MSTTKTKMRTIRHFLCENRVTMSVDWTDSNPNMANSERMNHWRCILRCGGKRMTLVFSMGPALSGEPTVAAVLDCLASDASSVENARGFEGWCGDSGYDTDSRAAERTYRGCVRQAASLKRLLGETAYDTLLWHTERE